MVAPVENLTRLVGRVAERAPHPTLPDWDLVTLAVDRAEGVAGKADLLSRRADRPLQVAVRRELLGDAGPGWRLDGRARVTAGGALLEAYPHEGDLRLSPP